MLFFYNWDERTHLNKIHSLIFIIGFFLFMIGPWMGLGLENKNLARWLIIGGSIMIAYSVIIFFIMFMFVIIRKEQTRRFDPINKLVFDERTKQWVPYIVNEEGDIEITTGLLQSCVSHCKSKGLKH
jgi:hypothetical protein